MRFYISLFVIICSTFLCFSGPCDDSLYLSLKKRDLNSLSDREYQYLLLKEEYCLKMAISPKASTVDSIATALLCTLEVRADRVLFKSAAMPISVYVNGCSYGKPPQTIALRPGTHRINLFSDDGYERRRSFNIPNRNNERSLTNIDLRPGDHATIKYTWYCEDPEDCDEDEWYFLPEIIRR